MSELDWYKVAAFVGAACCISCAYVAFMLTAERDYYRSMYRNEKRCARKLKSMLDETLAAWRSSIGPQPKLFQSTRRTDN